MSFCRLIHSFRLVYNLSVFINRGTASLSYHSTESKAGPGSTSSNARRHICGPQIPTCGFRYTYSSAYPPKYGVHDFPFHCYLFLFARPITWIPQRFEHLFCFSVFSLFMSYLHPLVVFVFSHPSDMDTSGIGILIEERYKNGDKTLWWKCGEMFET